MQKFVIQWHITHKCNLRCKHCYQDEYASDTEYEKLREFFFQIIDFLKEKKYKGHINFTGGEPLLSKHIFDLFDLCEKYNITFGLLTNGTIINSEICNKLSKYKKLSFVQVSIDGRKSTHDLIRGNGNFNLTFNNLKLLKKSNIKTMISFTCHKENYKDVEEVIKFSIKNKIDVFWLDRLIPFGHNVEDLINKDEYKQVLDILKKYKNKSKHTDIRTNRALQWYCDESGYYTCSAGKTLLAILADGTLLPCRRLPIKLGNLLDDTLLNIYNDSKVIKSLNQDIIPAECKYCLKSSVCRGGLRCLSYALYGNYNVKDKDCFIN